MLKAACRQEMWIYPLDARKRGINDGDKVRIFTIGRFISGESDATNDAGVVALGEGAWYDPDTKRVDGGCINVWTTQRPSPLAKGKVTYKPCSG
ncbi:molybdopterin dinucleotide binding domain-containing protein [Shigella flexneri]